MILDPVRELLGHGLHHSFEQLQFLPLHRPDLAGIIRLSVKGQSEQSKNQHLIVKIKKIHEELLGNPPAHRLKVTLYPASLPPTNGDALIGLNQGAIPERLIEASDPGFIRWVNGNSNAITYRQMEGSESGSQFLTASSGFAFPLSQHRQERFRYDQWSPYPGSFQTSNSRRLRIYIPGPDPPAIDPPG